MTHHQIDHFYYSEKKYSWDHKSTGAAGRLKSKSLQPLFDLLKLENPELKYNFLIKIFEESYLNHSNLADATFEIINTLFG